ncbi:MAG: hypothetical protein U0136_13455 [Bdellovibrionota bacterium]
MLFRQLKFGLKPDGVPAHFLVYAKETFADGKFGFDYQLYHPETKELISSGHLEQGAANSGTCGSTHWMMSCISFGTHFLADRPDLLTEYIIRYKTIVNQPDSALSDLGVIFMLFDEKQGTYLLGAQLSMDLRYAIEIYTGGQTKPSEAARVFELFETSPLKTFVLVERNGN